MEKINYLPNGQWTLEKSIPKDLDHYAFNNKNPDNIFTGIDAEDAQNAAYYKALTFNKNSVKNMPNEKGELEDHVLLHRGIQRYDPQQAGKHNTFKIAPDHVEMLDSSVHTVYPKLASDYSRPMDDEAYYIPNKVGRVISFWVPKSKIHHMGGHPASKYDMEHEEEQLHTSIKPGKYARATPEEVKLSSRRS